MSDKSQLNTPGAIRFNTDSMKLESIIVVLLGLELAAPGEWVQITTDTPDIQTGGTRGLIWWYNPSDGT